MDPQQLVQFLTSPPESSILLTIKIGFLVFSAILVAVSAYSFFTTTWFKRMYTWDVQEFLTYRPHGLKKIAKDWQKTKARLDAGMESEYKLAILEADALLADVLKNMGFGGETLGERLDKLTKASLPSLEEARMAHQTRNNVIHDPNYRLTLDESRKILAVFEKSLLDLQAL